VNALGSATALAHACLMEQAVQGRTADRDLLDFGQHLLQVTHVQVLVLAPRSCQGHNPLYQRRIRPVVRRATSVAVLDRRQALLPKPGLKPVGLPLSDPKHLTGRLHIQPTRSQAAHYLCFAPFSSAQCDGPHTLV